MSRLRWDRQPIGQPPLNPRHLEGHANGGKVRRLTPGEIEALQRGKARA